MKNSTYYIAPVGDRTHDLPHTVASNMVKVSHALNHSATEAVSPFYLGSAPGEVKYPTQGGKQTDPCRGLHISFNHFMCYPKDGLFGVYITKKKMIVSSGKQRG